MKSETAAASEVQNTTASVSSSVRRAAPVTLDAPPAQQRHATRKVYLLLSSGFGLAIIFLLLAGFWSYHSLESIRELISRQRDEQNLSAQLTDQMHNHLATLGAVLHAAFRSGQSRETRQVMYLLDRFQADLQRIVEIGQRTREREHWERLQKVGMDFSREVDNFFVEPVANRSANRLFDLHDALMTESSRLLHARYLNAGQARTQIATAANTMVRRTILLLVVAGILALVCGILTVRYTWRLINEIEEQSSELNRVSWQLVHSQELTARRLAHELHDALGQTLAALRANLIVLKRNVGAEAHRVSDSLELVDEAISSTREMAHLMRPSILDDFGLDASLSWLAEKFTQRTQIQVSYESEFTERLPDESETHLFRIAQEALTNISRHAQASRVSIRLWPDDGRLRLSIRDNGVGLPESTNSRKSSLGLNGMRARARMLGGELALGRPQGGGTAVEVWIPLSGEVYGSKNSHSLGG